MHLVLLLPSVPRTDEGDGTCYLLVIGDELSEGDGQWLFNEPNTISAGPIRLKTWWVGVPFDGKGPVWDVLVLDIRYGTVVSNIE